MEWVTFFEGIPSKWVCGCRLLLCEGIILEGVTFEGVSSFKWVRFEGVLRLERVWM